MPKERNYDKINKAAYNKKYYKKYYQDHREELLVAGKQYRQNHQAQQKAKVFKQPPITDTARCVGCTIFLASEYAKPLHDTLCDWCYKSRRERGGERD